MHDLLEEHSSSAWPDSTTERIVEFSQRYQELKKKQNVVDYDDLLTYWLQLLQEHPQVAQDQQQRFRCLLVDEFQDTNRLQAAIVDTIGNHHNVMAVGDDAQCIYTWRGADFTNISTFSDRHPEAVTHTIGINYRSRPQILNFANAILAAQPAGAGFYKELQAVREPHMKPQVIAVPDTYQQAQCIITRLRGLLDEGRQYSDIAVLYRAHYQALDVQLELQRAGIPFVITSGLRFFEQAHVKDVLAQIRFLSNPQDVSAFMRFAMLLPKIGERTAVRLHAKAIEVAESEGISPVQALTDPSVKPPADAASLWQTIAGLLQELDPAGRQTSPEEMVRSLIEGWYIDFMHNLYVNWETRLDDLQSLAGFASRFDDVSEMLTQLTILNAEPDAAQGGGENGQPPDALRLSTIHQAKGLEFPVVFLISLSEGLFPLRRAVENDTVEEERRLFYVGATRARDELYMSFPQMNTQSSWPMRLKPSRFLREVPESLYDMLRHVPQRSFR